MQNITPAQMRKIHALSRERGIDNDVLHAHVLMLVKRNSLKELTIVEAVKVIDSLSGDDKDKAVEGMMTAKQKKYIDGLLKDIGWTDKNGRPDQERLSAFISERFHISQMQWVTSKKASEVIEALKAMKSRKNKEDKAV